MSCSVNDALPVEVDHSGGGVLRGQASSSVTVVSPGLCYLDVIDCPELASLDLPGRHPNYHATLRGCPALRSLRVPVRGSGVKWTPSFGPPDRSSKLGSDHHWRQPASFTRELLGRPEASNRQHRSSESTSLAEEATG